MLFCRRFVTAPADNDKWWVCEEESQDVDIGSSDELEDNNTAAVNSQEHDVVCNGGL